MTKNKRVELYKRLPEIYRIKDEDLPKTYFYGTDPVPAFQLRSYLEPVEEMFSAIHENIESLYHDLFIETCDEWVIPYIADLLGTTHLSGDGWTLRADVASTIALRRRKGTLGAIELLTFVLTKWGVHSVELRENMLWNQHINHQRPDEGGPPPYGLPKIRPETPVRGGTVSLRDPSLLATLGTPFDPFAHVADVKPHETGQIRYNLPNLAIYLWRLRDYRLNITKPLTEKSTQAVGAPHVVRVNVDPVPVNKLSQPYVEAANTPEGRPGVLFNTNRFELFNKKRSGADKLNLSAIAPRISAADHVPGPMPVERISDFDVARAYDDSLASPVPLPFEVFADASFTAPQEYIAVESFDLADPLQPLDITDVGLQLHLPKKFAGENWLHTALPRSWKIRGENLCAWEKGVHPPLEEKEIAVDPKIGRICIGVSTDARAQALVDEMLLTFTYGFPGDVGAHPISYAALDPDIVKTAVQFKVSALSGAGSLQDVLTGISARAVPTVIEITNSFTHPLDINALPAADKINEGGMVSIKLGAPLIIRAADNERPIIELARPLAFRPAKVAGADETEQKKLDAAMNVLFVRLEGIYFARRFNYSAGLPLISRAALNRLEILNCTLDPGGFMRLKDNSRAPLLPGLNLTEPYGFDTAAEEIAFKQAPEIVIQRSICGAIFADEGYRLCLTDSIIESVPIEVPLSGGGTRTDPFAIAAATDPLEAFAAGATIRNITVLGRTRVNRIDGAGGIFTGVLEVFDEQYGCLKFCYFADDSASLPPPDEVKNRLPQNFACVKGGDARLIFTSEFFGDPAYCQLSLECDPRILEEGPGNDQMGAFNFLLEAHKWRNLKIRFREFMPAGVRPLLIPVT